MSRLSAHAHRGQGHLTRHLSAAVQSETASGAPVLDAECRHLAALFQALSAPARIKLIMHLHQGEHCAGALAEAVSTTQSNVSQHLALLLNLGFVHRRRAGQQVFYRLRHDYWGKLLAELCATAPEGRGLAEAPSWSFSREAKPQDHRA